MRGQGNDLNRALLKRCYFLLFILTIISSTINATRDGSLAIMTMFKNEGRRINEYLIHYMKEGVTQFILIDDNSTDSGECIINQFAKEYPDLQVNYLKWPTQNTKSVAYNACIGKSTRAWTLVVDVDEFVFATEGTIPMALEKIEDNVGCVVNPYLTFGSHGLNKQPESIITGFLSHPYLERMSWVKSIVRTKTMDKKYPHAQYHMPCSRKHDIALADGSIISTTQTGAHNNWLIAENSTISVAEQLKLPLRLNHYQYQSKEQWRFQRAKGTVDDTALPTRPGRYTWEIRYTWEVYNSFNNMTQVPNHDLLFKRGGAAAWEALLHSTYDEKCFR